MANEVITGVLYEDDRDVDTAQIKRDVHDKRDLKEHKQELIFNRIAFYIFFHLAALYGLYLAFTSSQWKTNLFGK